MNRAEAKAIIDEIARVLDDGDFEGSIGVIAPFNAQVGLLQRRAAEALPRELRDDGRLRVGTVDRFQGGEADLVLLSIVATRHLHAGGKSFLSRDSRRLNVAVSRAKVACHVFGDLGYARASGMRRLARLAEMAAPEASPNKGVELFDSVWERRVDAALRRRGLEPHPQYPVGARRLDFALFGGDGMKLDLEVDGRRWHTDADGRRKTADILRDRELRALGWRVRRFWVHELEMDMEGCLDAIERDLGRR